MRRFHSCVIGFAFLMVCTSIAVAQNKRVPASHPAHLPPDPQIIQAMAQVSEAQLRGGIEKLVTFGTRLTLTSDIPLSTGRGIAAARDWIKSEFERYSNACNGCLEIKTDTFTADKAERIPRSTEITNVYAILRGSNPEDAKRLIVVCGHYDSRASDTFDKESLAPGANDDGSGTVVVLESARVLSKHRFPATIVFLTVAGEEQGLFGARHFARMAKEQGWKIEAVLNNDIVGGDRSAEQDPTSVRVFSEGLPLAATPEEWRRIRMLGTENDSISRQLARSIVETSAQYSKYNHSFTPRMIYRQDRFLRGGDHTAFNEQGFAAVRFTEWREDYNHQHQNLRTENGIEYGDLPKFVNFTYLANVARLNVSTLASLASAPEPPAQVRIVTKNLENDTTLIWQPSSDGRAGHYEVLWRATSSAEWEGVRDVGQASTAKLPVSKDNVVFAVRAVSANGHRSLAVVPAPER